MRLTELPAVLIEDLLRTWRRRLVVGVIVAASALAAVIHSIEAARLALQFAVGPVGARLILVGVFALIIGVAMAMLLRAERRDAERKRASQPGKDEKVAVIAEAVSLGYALAQDFRRGRAAEAGAADAPNSDAGVAEPKSAARAAP